jgi:hypothetical protein
MPAEATLLASQVETRALVRKVGRARACSTALRRGALRTLVADAERFVFAREIEGDVAGAAIVVLSRRPSLAAEVKLAPGAPSALVDLVTGTKVDVSSGVLPLPEDAFGVHVYVDAGGSCGGGG